MLQLCGSSPPPPLLPHGGDWPDIGGEYNGAGGETLQGISTLWFSQIALCDTRCHWGGAGGGHVWRYGVCMEVGGGANYSPNDA